MVNGTTIHEQLRRRSSSTSVPITPITPLELQIPEMETFPAETENSVLEPAVLTSVSSACSLPGSEHSSASCSFIGPEVRMGQVVSEMLCYLVVNGSLLVC